MKKIVIISGGRLEKESALAFLEKGQEKVIIGVDGGLKFCHENKIMPDYIVGDFDTIEPEILEVFRGDEKIRTVQYRPEKDLTDTQAAVELAIKLAGKTEEQDLKEQSEIVLLGGTGSRMDHTLANIGCLQYALEHSVPMKIIDDNNCMYLCDQSFCLQKEELVYRNYISLIALGNTVSNLTIKGMKYETESLELESLSSRGVSNEMQGDTAEITFTSGRVLVIESRD